jgi:excisionase family DNA binding protein
MKDLLRMADRDQAPYRVREAAKRLGVSDKAVLDALKSGAIAGFRMKRMWLIPRHVIDRMSGASAA